MFGDRLITERATLIEAMAMETSRVHKVPVFEALYLDWQRKRNGRSNG